MSKIKPVIKWSGSKRFQAEEIVSRIPEFNRYFEPFLGGGSIMYLVQPREGYCNDICAPLISLWEIIKDSPESLISYYETTWNRMQTEGYQVYYEIRDQFNKDFSPYHLLFLSRTCVNGLIRFNDKGHFNNSLHYSRKGINPASLSRIILDWSSKVQNIQFTSFDYKVATASASKGDFVYLDPPYFNTKGRYYGTTTIDFDEFFAYLEALTKKEVLWALSFDGKTTAKDYGVSLPENIFSHHYHIPAGNSTFNKVMNKQRNAVLESLYTNY